VLRAFWTCNDYPNSKWFFDKSVWQKMLRTMSGCGFDSMILASAEPIDDAAASDYDQMRRWILEAALDYQIAPYVFLRAGECTRELLETYPELKGIFVDANNGADALQGVVDAVDAARPDALVYLRVGTQTPAAVVDDIKRRGNKRVGYSVKYTCDHLVDANPDPAFVEWVEAVGAENVLAEFAIANFEPWTSFSYDTIEGALANLQELGCEGFSLQPLSVAEWPHTSDSFFKYQWQRDLVWYSVWGGTSVERLVRQGQPKWLVRNQKLVAGFEAGSRILELLSLYFAGDKSMAWRPQFCSVQGGSGMRLLSIEDMLHLDDMPEFCALDWWQEITGDRVVHLAEYIKSGTPEDAYGPEELIEELSDLCQQAVAAGERGMRSASGEKELPSFARDAFCTGRLGEFYVERLRAALSHARGDSTEAVEHLTRALGLYREIAAVDSSHRAGASFGAIAKALEAECDDAARGVFGRGGEYLVHKTG